jgi:hypothetical protein
MALAQALTVMGLAERIDPHAGSFRIRCLDDTVSDAFIGTTTDFWVLTNLDGLDNDRVPNPEGYDGSPSAKMRVLMNLARQSRWRKKKASNYRVRGCWPDCWASTASRVACGVHKLDRARWHGRFGRSRP